MSNEANLGKTAIDNNLNALSFVQTTIGIIKYSQINFLTQFILFVGLSTSNCTWIGDNQIQFYGFKAFNVIIQNSRFNFVSLGNAILTMKEIKPNNGFRRVVDNWFHIVRLLLE